MSASKTTQQKQQQQQQKQQQQKKDTQKVLGDYLTKIKSPSPSEPNHDRFTTPPSASSSANKPQIEHSPPSPLENTSKKNKSDQPDPLADQKIDIVDQKLNIIMDMVSKNATRMDNLAHILSDNSENIKKINKRMDTFEQSLSFTNSQIEESRSNTSDLSFTVTQQAKVIDSLVQKVEMLEKKLKLESIKRDNSEAVGRKQNLEISGIPRAEPEPKELLKQRVLDIANKLGAPISLSDIDDAHRKRSGGVIVRFSGRPQRDALFDYTIKPELKPRLKELTTASFSSWPAPERGMKLFINENLSEDRARLARVCRDKIKIINQQENRTGHQRLRISFSAGIVTAQDCQGRFRRIRSVDDFDELFKTTVFLTQQAFVFHLFFTMSSTLVLHCVSKEVMSQVCCVLIHLSPFNNRSSHLAMFQGYSFVVLTIFPS